MGCVKAMMLLILIQAISEKSNAQLNPFGAAYFQNQYLFNPAMAGTEQKLKLNVAYRKEWNDISNGPVNQYLSGDFGLSDKVGVGLKVINDKAGVLSTTGAMATYSYHIGISDKQKLHFGDFSLQYTIHLP